MLGPEEIENRFGTHKATLEGPNPSAEIHSMIRIQFKDLASYLDQVLPEGREKATMFTNLETASMWAHKTLAKDQPIVKTESVPYFVQRVGLFHEQALMILETLKKIVSNHGFATVSDFYSLCDVHSDTVANELFGWDDLREVSLSVVGQKTHLVFPNPKPIKDIQEKING